MSRRGLSLEEVSKNYSTILVDTCVLIGEIGCNGYEIERDSAHFFIDYINNNGSSICVIPSVFREYSNGSSFLHRKDLLKTIQSNSGILELSEGEKLWYDLLVKEYSGIQDKFGLGNTDYDFLVSGVVLSEARKEPIALVSNDMGILRAWKFFLMNECLSPIELGFFMRKRGETFKKVKPPKNYKKL